MNFADFITIIRIICALCMLFTKPLAAAFLVLYALCGVSDILDGFIARKMHMESERGARLDSIADIVFGAALAVKLIPILPIPLLMVIWIVVIAAVRCTSYLIGYRKYHAFSSLHTYSNKLTGLMLFISPVLFLLFGFRVTGYILCVIASVSTIEELLITVKSKTLNRDCKTIFYSSKY